LTFNRWSEWAVPSARPAGKFTTWP